MQIDWKALRERAGLTLEQVAEKSGYAVTTINGLELRDEGSERLRERLLDVLEAPRVAESVDKGRADSVKPGSEFRDDTADYRTTDDWKREAIESKAEVARLKSAMIILLNSKPLSVEQELGLGAATAARRLAQESEPKRKAAAPTADKPGPAGAAPKDSK